MATHSEVFSASATPSFRTALAVSLAKTATAISSEPADAEFHVYRARLATSVLASPENYAAQFAISVAELTQATPSAMPDDVAIDNACSGLWNAWAGTSAIAPAPPAPEVAGPPAP